MKLFDKNLKTAEIINLNDSFEKQINNLKKLREKLNYKGQELIDLDIKKLEYGHRGEQNIIYELVNSHIPMKVIHDIYISDGEQHCQLDFVVITRKLIFLLESKNLYGNIEINNKGEFIRSFEYNGKYKKEGIYSPINQANTHAKLLEKIIKEGKSNAINILGILLNVKFEDMYKSTIVISNPKTVINQKYAKKEVKNRIVKVDNLISYIKEEYNNSRNLVETDTRLMERVEFFKSINQKNPNDYLKKYESFIVDTKENLPLVDKEALRTILKSYRLEISKKENIKPYYVFNDKQLEDILDILPKNKDEFISINGFKDTKYNKYGKDIVSIVTNMK